MIKRRKNEIIRERKANKLLKQKAASQTWDSKIEVEPIKLLPTANLVLELAASTSIDYREYLGVIDDILTSSDESYISKSFLTMCSKNSYKKINSVIHDIFINIDHVTIYNRIGLFKLVRIKSLIYQPLFELVDSVIKALEFTKITEKFRLQIKLAFYSYNFEEVFVHFLYKIIKIIYILPFYFRHLKFGISPKKFNELQITVTLQYYRILKYFADFNYVFEDKELFRITSTSKAANAWWFNIKKTWCKIKELFHTTIRNGVILMRDCNVMLDSDMIENVIDNFDYVLKLLLLFSNSFLRYFYNCNYLINRLNTMNILSDSHDTFFQIPVKYRGSFDYFNEARSLMSIDKSLNSYKPTIELQVWAFLNNFYKSKMTKELAIGIHHPVFSIYSVYSYYLYKRFVNDPIKLMLDLSSVNFKGIDFHEATYIEILLKSQKISKMFHESPQNKIACRQLQFGSNLSDGKFSFHLPKFNKSLFKLPYCLKGIYYAKYRTIYNDIYLQYRGLTLEFKSLSWFLMRLSRFECSFESQNHFIQNIMRNLTRNIYYKEFVEYVFLINDYLKLKAKDKQSILRVCESTNRIKSGKDLLIFMENHADARISVNNNLIEHLIKSLGSIQDEEVLNKLDDLDYNENILMNFQQDSMSWRQKPLITRLNPDKCQALDLNRYQKEDEHLIEWLKQLLNRNVFENYVEEKITAYRNTQFEFLSSSRDDDEIFNENQDDVSEDSNEWL